MTTVNQERRRFFRIEDTVNMLYKSIDEKSMPEGSHVSDDILSSCSLAAALDSLNQEARIMAARLEKNHIELFEYLNIMNSKIDLLAQTVMMQGAEFEEHDTRNVNISASGLAFETEEALKTGQFLEVKIMLTSCMAVIIAYARVIYCRQNDEGEFPYYVGIDYINMKDEDRELLIKHVVKKQMQQIRQNKSSDGKAED